jgi:hypothetical protein
MKSLKFLRNVAVYAIHREQGSVHEIQDADAAQLIADGAAILFTAPVKSTPETAVAKPANKETASRK